MRRVGAAIVSGLVLGGVVLGGVRGASAGSSSSHIRRGLHNAPRLVNLDAVANDERYRNAVDVILESAARRLPIPAMSGAFTYRFEPETGEYTRATDTFGPQLLLERPQTVGRYVWGVGVYGQYLEYDEFDGDRIGRDPDPLIVGLGTVSGTTQTTSLSVTPKPVYHLLTVNLTYGLTDDLDVNVVVPVAATDFDANVRRQNLGSSFTAIATEHGHVSLGIADMFVRAKYRLCDHGGWTTALGLKARLPVGDTQKGLGIGDGEVGPFLAFSTPAWHGVEGVWNAGVDFNVIDPHRSSAHYAVGASAQATEWASLTAAVLGRSDVDGAREASSVSALHLTSTGPAERPYLGISVDRKDYFDLAFGTRVRLWRTLVLTLNGIYALNDEGLRSSEVSPMGGIEGTF